MLRVSRTLSAVDFLPSVETAAALSSVTMLLALAFRLRLLDREEVNNRRGPAEKDSTDWRLLPKPAARHAAWTLAFFHNFTMLDVILCIAVWMWCNI